MPLGHLFFGFTGRINRAKAWGAMIALFVIGVVAMTVLLVTLFDEYDLFNANPEDFIITRIGRLGGLGILLLVIWLVVFVSQLAIGVKRLHDRDKSGWWVLVFVFLPWALSLPTAGSYWTTSNGFEFNYELGGGGILNLIAFAIVVWGFIEMGCLRGTIGPNRFGSDPLPSYGGAGGLADPPYPGQAPPPGRR